MPIISTFPTGSGGNGGGGGIPLDSVTGIATLASAGKAYLKWTDPADKAIGDTTLAAWAGTLLVRKAGSAPASRRDGTVVLDNKTRNAYQNQYFMDSGLSDGVTYYYKFFPYSTTNTYTDDPQNEVSVTPNPVPIGDVSGLAVAAQLNGRVQLTWNDPAATKVQDGVTLSTWASTKVVYKTGSYPTSPDDGTLVENSTTRNAHASSPLEVTGLTNGTTYYFALFPISTEGAVTTSNAGHITAIPNKIKLTAVPAQSGTLTYTGAELTPTFSNYDPAKLTIGGVTKNTAAGTYKATFTPTADYCWSDGSTTAQEVSWTIDKASIAVPTTSSSFTYDGNQKTPVWTGYDSSKMTMSGDSVGTNAGTYTVHFTLTDNYKWNDGTTEVKDVTWNIAKKSIAKVTAATTSWTYDGSTHIPTWSNYNSDEITIGGTTTAKSGVGNYSTTFVPKSNYQWADGTTGTVTINWSVTVLSIAAPSATPTSFTYSGSAQVPTFTYNSTYVTIGGDTTGKTAVGNYSATFTLKDTTNTKWADNTTAAKSIAWSIVKAAGSSSLNKTSVTLNTDKLSDTVTVTRSGTGAITATSSNTNIATVSVSGNVVTISSVNKASGSATITIKVAADDSYNAPTDKTVSVSAEFVPAKAALNSMSWADIRKVSDAGLASSYWSVGDVKQLTINGTVGSTAISNFSTNAFIIGFDHNSAREGANKIHFQLGITAAGGNKIAFIDGGYNSYQTANGSFTMNPGNSSTSSNAGGWENSHMRKTVLGSQNTPSSPGTNTFLAALPSDLRNVMKPVTKYSDNTGGTTNAVGAMTATTDYLFLLSEHEVFGTKTYGSQHEATYQEQYAYYKVSSNSKVFYRHSANTSTAYWWLRSVYAGDTYYFCAVDTDGTANAYDSGRSYGVAPGFCV